MWLAQWSVAELVKESVPPCCEPDASSAVVATCFSEASRSNLVGSASTLTSEAEAQI